MNLRLLGLVLAAHLTTAPGPATAQEPSPEEAIRLDEINVTAETDQQVVDDSPTAVQVVTREEIERTASDNVEKVLDLVPDLYIRRNDQFRLGASTVRMQGADPNKVAILLNGRRFQGGVDGVVDLRDIPTDNIERIEIIRGPASSLYGSDAMAGVINIITRQGSEHPSFEATMAGGTFDRLLANASHGYSIGDLTYFLSYQHDEVALAQQYGAISSQFEGDAGDAKQVRDNIFSNLTYQLTPQQQVSATVNYNPVREGPESHRDNLTTGAGWSWQPTDAWDSGLDFNRYAFARKNDLVGFEEDVHYEDWAGQGRLSYAARGSLAGEQQIITLGYRIRSESLDMPSTSRGGTAGNPVVFPSVHESALHNSPYMQDEILLDDAWSIVVGSSLDLNEYFSASVDPRLSIGWRPNDLFRITASVGRGYRAPDLLQLFDIDANNIVVNGDRVTGYVILGNPNLQPETDLGATLQVEARPVSGVAASVSFFRHDFHDLIAVELACLNATTCSGDFEHPFPDLNGQVFRYNNVSKALTEGFDIGLGLEPLEWLDHGAGDNILQLQLSYGFLHAVNLDPRPGEGKELPYRPPNRAIITLDTGRRDLGIRSRFVAEYEDRTFTELANSTEFIAESHWIFDTRLEIEPARLLSRWPLSGTAGQIWRGISFFTEASNLADAEYGVPGPMGNIAGKRSVLAGVSYVFQAEDQP